MRGIGMASLWATVLVVGCGSVGDGTASAPHPVTTPATDEVGDLQGRVADPEAELRTSRAEITSLREQENSLREMQEAAEQNGRLLAEQLEAAHRNGEPEARPGTGKVMACDSENDIYLIGLGRGDGVEPGDELTIFRKDLFVAVVVVDKVFEDKCSAVVKVSGKTRMVKMPIAEGDGAARTR